MNALMKLRLGGSWLALASIGGLLLVLLTAGVVGILINRNVNNVAREALQYDIQLEDRADDLRTAVLDLRHYHRNIVFAGPSRGGLADLDEAYQQVLSRIDNLDELDVSQEAFIQPAEIRELAEQYHAAFRPSVDLYDTDREQFTLASDNGLILINQLDSRLREIEQIGEQRAEAALENVEAASRTATLDLLVVLGGLVVFGAVLAWVAVRTSNELRALYAGQQETSSQLADALRARNDFIADASHELRTPLTVLRGNAEVGLDLERDCVHTPFLEEIVRESERMTHLVEDLLFLARSDSGALPLDLVEVHSSHLMAGLIDAAEMLARQTGAVLETSLSGDESLLVEAARIEQALLILVDNATKYSPPGSPVALRSRIEGARFLLEVEDEGSGIDASDLPFIFERFYRVDKTRSRKVGGTGLGLPIARSIIEAHGGEITAQSIPGSGTTMTISLPLTASQPQGRIERGSRQSTSVLRKGDS